MNQFKITVHINTWSEDPTDWIADYIVDCLEEGEELTSITTVRYENDNEKTECDRDNG